MNVFCYWRNLDGSTNLPPYIQLCFDTIQKHHPNVELVTPENISVGVPDEWYELIPAHQADYLRPRYIAKYGGLFVDIDTVFFEDFYESEYYSPDAQMIGFSYRKDSPTIGVLYGKQHCCYMEKWAEYQDKIIGRNNHWTALGADSLWKVKFGSDYFEYSAKHIQPFAWQENKKFNLDLDIGDQMCCALFNKNLPMAIKNMSREELLESDKMIGKMFRKGLDV